MADNEQKVPFTDILRSVAPEKFGEVFSASSRKARETYFHRHNVRAPAKMSRLPKPGAKNEARISQLFDLLKTSDDDEMSEEILRTWLLTKRSLLAAALDHLGIAHEAGLTESDEIKKFESLGKKDVRALMDVLASHGTVEEISIYLRFMGVKDLDKKLG